MLGSALAYSLMSVLVKFVGTHLPPTEIALFRGTITLAMSYWTVRRLGLSPLGQSTRWLLLRGLVGVMGLHCYFYALTALPLAEATVLHFLSPIFVAALSPWVLKETLRPRDALGVGLGFAGVLIVSRPAIVFGAHGGTLPLVGTVVAVMGATFGACAYLIVRKLRDTEDPMVVVLHSTMLIAPVSLPLALREWVWPTPLELVALAGIAVFAQLGQMQMTRGLHLETAARATAVSYAQVPLTIVWSACFFGIEPTPTTILGAAAVFAGTTLIARAPRAPKPSWQPEAQPGERIERNVATP